MFISAKYNDWIAKKAKTFSGALPLHSPLQGSVRLSPRDSYATMQLMNMWQTKKNKKNIVFYIENNKHKSVEHSNYNTKKNNKKKHFTCTYT